MRGRLTSGACTTLGLCLPIFTTTPLLPLPFLSLHPSLNSARGKWETIRGKLPCCHCPPHSSGRMMDGCVAKMMHADGPVSVPRRSPVPPTTRDGLSTAARAGDGALREVAGKRGSLMFSRHRLRQPERGFKTLLEIGWKDMQSKQCASGAS